MPNCSYLQPVIHQLSPSNVSHRISVPDSQLFMSYYTKYYLDISSILHHNVPQYNTIQYFTTIYYNTQLQNPTFRTKTFHGHYVVITHCTELKNATFVWPPQA